MKDLKKILTIFLRFAISIVLLVFLFRYVDTKKLFELIKSSDKFILFIAFAFFFLNYALCLLRWEMLLKTVKIHLPLKRVIISFAGGTFFSLFLPSTIGGDLMRSIDLAIHTKRPREVVATVFLDRLSGYVGLVLLALVSLVIGWKLVKDRAILLSVAIIVGILVCVLLVLFNRFIYNLINKLLHSPTGGKIRNTIRDLHQEMHYFRHHEDMILDNLILSVIIQATAPITFYLIALSMGLKISAIYFFVFIPLVGAISLLPISLGGLGLRDATTIFFFAKAGVSSDLAFAMSLLHFSILVIYGLIGGLIYVLTIHHRRVQHHSSSAVSKLHQ